MCVRTGALVYVQARVTGISACVLCALIFEGQKKGTLCIGYSRENARVALACTVHLFLLCAASGRTVSGRAK